MTTIPRPRPISNQLEAVLAAETVASHLKVELDLDQLTFLTEVAGEVEDWLEGEVARRLAVS